MADPNRLLEALAADPAGLCVLSDFDGTLSEIQLDPATVQPVPGAMEALARLAGLVGRVAIVTGRPAAFAAARLGPARIDVHGLYGLELVRAGTDEVVVHPLAEPWRAPIAEATDEAFASMPPGVLVEAKGLATAVHYRTAPEHQATVEGWTAAVAERLGLEAHPGRMHVELRPPVHLDKGDVVAELAAEASALAFLGDDVGDAPAFRVVQAFAVDRGPAATVLVASDETPPELAALADVRVVGPTGAVAWLRALAEAIEGPTR